MNQDQALIVSRLSVARIDEMSIESRPGFPPQFRR